MGHYECHHQRDNRCNANTIASITSDASYAVHSVIYLHPSMSSFWEEEEEEKKRWSSCWRVGREGGGAGDTSQGQHLTRLRSSEKDYYKIQFGIAVVLLLRGGRWR